MGGCGQSIGRQTGLIFFMSHQNLFSALRAAFPAQLDQIAIETDQGLSGVGDATLNGRELAVPRLGS